MNRYGVLLAVTATLALASGCGKSPADKLVGQWQLKLESEQQQKLDEARTTLAKNDDVSVAADVAETIVAMLDMRLEITPDEIVFRGGGREVRSTYRVIEQTKTTVTIEAERRGNDGPLSRKGTITFVSDDEILLSVPTGDDENRAFVRVVP